MKNKKLLLTAIATAALFGVGAIGGTVAFFTSSSTHNITAKTAKVDLESEIDQASLKTYSLGVEQEAGKFENIGSTAEFDANSDLVLNNVAPGDKATFDVILKNNSTIEIKYSVTISVLDGEGHVLDNHPFVVAGASAGTILPTVSEETVNVGIELPETVTGDELEGVAYTIRLTVDAYQANIPALELVNKAMTYSSKVNRTFTEAMEEAASLDSSFEAKEYLWDSERDQFLKEPEEALADAYKYYKVYTAMPATQTYSIYAGEGWSETAVNLSVGFDVGENTNVTSITYDRASATTAQSVYLRTNGGDITVNAPLDTVYHYGLADNVNIIAVANDTYHEFGSIANDVSISQGHLQLEKGGAIPQISVENVPDGQTVSVTANEATMISVDQASADKTTVAANAKGIYVAGLKEERISGDESSSVVPFAVVHNDEELKEALKNSVYIQLGADFTMEADGVAFGANKEIVFDLNGYTLTNEKKNIVLKLDKNALLTVKDSKGGGKIVNTANSSIIDVSATSKLVLESGELIANLKTGNSSVCAVKLYKDSEFEMLGGHLYGTYKSLSVLTNSKATISGGVIELESTSTFYAAIQGTSGSDVTLSGDAKVISNVSGVAADKLVVKDNVEISSGEYGINGSKELDLLGGKVASENSYAIYLSVECEPNISKDVELQAGENLPKIYITNGHLGVDTDPALIEASNSNAIVVDANGAVTGYYVAQYAGTLASTSGKTIRLTKDINIGTTFKLSITKPNITLDLNGHNITHTGYASGAAYAIQITATGAVITGEGTVKVTDISGTADKGVNAVNINTSAAGTITIKGGHYIVDGDNVNAAIYVMKGGSKSSKTGEVTAFTEVVVEGGTFGEASLPANSYLLNLNDSMVGTSVITVKGGTFYGYNPASNSSGANEVVVAEGYVVNEDNGVFTVVKA